MTTRLPRARACSRTAREDSGLAAVASAAEADYAIVLSNRGLHLLIDRPLDVIPRISQASSFGRGFQR